MIGCQHDQSAFSVKDAPNIDQLRLFDTGVWLYHAAEATWILCNNTRVNNRMKHSLLIVAAFIALLWVIEIADRVLGLGLYRLGVYPGEQHGLWGILYAPLIHGSWSHLASNSFALLLLGVALLYGYPRAARQVLALVYIGSGIGVWLFARHSYHIGASGLTHGMMFFIFTTGILRGDRFSIALSMIVFFLFGGMVWTIFPQEPGISYESHFFGAVCGVLAAFLFRDRDPRPAEKKYSWEDEDDENGDDHEAAKDETTPPDDGDRNLAVSQAGRLRVAGRACAGISP
jgi:membrane associated rhomboid family serine protease